MESSGSIAGCDVPVRNTCIADDDDSILDVVAHIIEDVEGQPAAVAVSISDVSSDPLEYRNRMHDVRSQSGSSSCAASIKGSDDDEDDEAKSIGDVPIDDEDDDDDGAVERGPSVGSSVDGRRPRVAPQAVETADLAEVDTAADAAVGRVDIGSLSDKPVAVVESVIVRSNTVVVANTPESDLVLDAGTRLCLPDGRVVGTITTLLGPVKDCAYAVCCDGELLAALHMENLLSEGTKLHADTQKQRVVYDPAAVAAASKPSDASFVNDEERPPNVRPDFSDDEDEKQWKRKKKEGLLSGARGTVSADDRGGLPAADGGRGETDDVSSIESEIEVDENGEVLEYHPKEHLSSLAPQSSAAAGSGVLGARGGSSTRGGRGNTGQPYRPQASSREFQNARRGGVGLVGAPTMLAAMNPSVHVHAAIPSALQMPPLSGNHFEASAPPPLKVMRTETRGGPSYFSAPAVASSPAPPQAFSYPVPPIAVHVLAPSSEYPMSYAQSDTYQHQATRSFLHLAPSAGPAHYYPQPMVPAGSPQDYYVGPRSYADSPVAAFQSHPAQLPVRTPGAPQHPAAPGFVAVPLVAPPVRQQPGEAFPSSSVQQPTVIQKPPWLR